jgi:hypothetical protein
VLAHFESKTVLYVAHIKSWLCLPPIYRELRGRKQNKITLIIIRKNTIVTAFCRKDVRMAVQHQL